MRQAEVKRANALRPTLLDDGRNKRLSHLAFNNRWLVPTIIALVYSVLAAAQLLSAGNNQAQELIGLGYFIPIAFSALYFLRRQAFFVTVLAVLVYSLALLPHLLKAGDAGNNIMMLLVYIALFVAAAWSLSGFHASINREKERALQAERERAERLKLLLAVSNTVSSSLKIEQVLQELSRRIVEAVGASFCRISLLDEGGEQLRVVAAHPVRELRWDPAVGKSLPLSELPDYRRAVESRTSVIVRSGSNLLELKKRRQRELMGRAQSLLLYPLVIADRTVGVVCIGEERNWQRSPFGPEKADLCQTIVNQGAVAVAHALSHRELEEAFIGTIRSLAEAIDAKDHYTRGHSDWVARYALMLGRQIGLGEDTLEVLRYAGYLHDIGKIGIPDQVLSKPSQLTAAEWQLMKKHPITSAKILEPVHISAEVKIAIRHHHERFDGKGYPQGLAGQAIPLEARILAVADAFESMTSSRPYRAALSEKEAMAELKRCAGTQFDPVMVEAFVRVLGEGDIEVGRPASASAD